MSIQKEKVKTFYGVIWDAHDKSAMPDILHEDFTFRRSLGQEKQGLADFAEYAVESVNSSIQSNVGQVLSCQGKCRNYLIADPYPFGAQDGTPR